MGAGAGEYGGKDYYLDKFGNPVPKNSKKSHIIP